MFKGSIVAIVTPFLNGKIDLVQAEAIADFALLINDLAFIWFEYSLATFIQGRLAYN